jgi:O-antigen/teichoic acid export membrane protein
MHSLHLPRAQTTDYLPPSLITVGVAAAAQPPQPEPGSTRLTAGILSAFVGAQAAIQLVNIAAGILVVNWLPKQQYGYLAICVAVTGGISVIANSGFSSTILSRGAEFREDPARLSVLYASVLRARRVVTLIVAAIAAPTLALLLARSGASPLAAALMTVLVLAGTWASVTTCVATDLLSLEYRRWTIQRISLVTSTARVAATAAIAVALPLATAATAVALNTLAAWFGQRLTTHAAHDLTDHGAATSAEDRTVALRNFRELLPSNLMLVFQGQITVFVLGFAGATNSLAELSAISRFAVVYTLVGATIAGVVAPMISRAAGRRVGRSYLSASTATLGVVLALTAVVALLSPALVTVLGSAYRGLAPELVIVFVGAGVACVADALSSMNQARGWVAFAWLQIPLSLATWLAAAFVLDLGTTRGAALFAAVGSVPGVATQLVQAIVGLRRVPERKAEVSHA